MKTKHSLVLFVVLFGICINSHAHSGYIREHCEFQGITSRHETTLQKEFAMLLAPKKSQKFQTIVTAIAFLAITPPEELNDPECPVYKYVRGFLAYYNKNKKKITKDKLYITKILNIIQETTEKTNTREKEEL